MTLPCFPKRARRSHPPLRIRRAATAAALATLLVLSALVLPGVAHGQSPADSSLALQWTAPGDDGSTGTATQYALRYRTVPIAGTDTLSWWNAATPVSGLPIPRPAGSTDSIRVRGLVPSTTYYFILRTADEVPNWSGFSNFAVLSTSGDLVAPGTIADLAITATTGSTIALRWTAPGNNGTTGTAASYDIRWSTSPITAANFAAATVVTGEPLPAVAGTAQTFTITGLQGGRVYYVAMKTADASGNVSAISNVASGSTLDVLAPAAVTDLRARP